MSDFEVSEQRVKDTINIGLTQPRGYVKIIEAILRNEKGVPNISDFAAVDFCIRQTIFKFIKANAACQNASELKQFRDGLVSMLKNLFQVYVRKGASTVETFATYQMIFDMITLKQADQVFPFLDDVSSHFRKHPENFSAAVKQGMLRLCNDLLRRLSATGSRDIQFSGKVQLYLTRLFPIDEKSALNLTSNFHTDNTTEFAAEDGTTLPKDEAAVKAYLERQKADKAGEKVVNGNASKPVSRLPSEDGEVDEMDTAESGEVTNETSTAAESWPVFDLKTVGPITVTYKVYKAIWTLQKYFNNPVQLFENEAHFAAFEKYADQVLGLFQDYQVESTQKGSARSTTASDQDNTFPKYLTSEQLCHLQIKDPQFRHQIVLQFVVLIQYIKSPPVKAQLRASAKMGKWVHQTGRKIENLLSSMSNTNFCAQLMSHEYGWITWKDRSCPSLMVATKDKAEFKIHPKTSERRKRSSIRAEMLEVQAKKLKATADDESEFMDFIRTKNYDDLPTPAQFFEEGFKIDNPIWRYKALRLLSEKSRLFWQMPPSKHCFKPISYYLETMRDRIKKEVAEWESAEERERKRQEENTAESDGEDDEMEAMNQTTAESAQKVPEKKDPMEEQVSDADATKLAKLIAKEAHVFSLKTLRLNSREVSQINKDTEDPEQRIKMYIGAWQDTHMEDASLTTRAKLHAAIVKTKPHIYPSLVDAATDWVVE